MTDDDVRALAQAEFDEFKRVNGRAGSIARWCRQNGVLHASLSLFMSGKVGPSAKLLDVLGLEWRIMRK